MNRPTSGKKAFKYRIELPDGSSVLKSVFEDRGETAPATAFRSNRNSSVIIAVVWGGKNGAPAWEGDFGLLTARRI